MLNHYKKNNARSFYEQNPQLYTFPLPTEEIFQVEQNRLVAKHPAVDFRSQPLELPLQKPLNT